MDEAMHPLTILAVGLYGKTLMNQNGAPIRLVVPWKYGFKSIKSIVRIRFVDKQPRTAWNIANPDEYGFYSNVNPEVDHPRWSQAREKRLPSLFASLPTLMFNGYGDQVASMYAGMDLEEELLIVRDWLSLLLRPDTDAPLVKPLVFVLALVPLAGLIFVRPDRPARAPIPSRTSC